VWRDAIARWPRATIILRQGARVVADSRPAARACTHKQSDKFGTTKKCRTRAYPSSAREATAALFLLAVLHHTGASFLHLVSAPGRLRQFPSLAGTLVQRLLPVAAHIVIVLCALRGARRCQSGDCEPRRQSRSDVFVPMEHASISFSFSSAPPAHGANAHSRRSLSYGRCMSANLPAASRRNVCKTVMPRRTPWNAGVARHGASDCWTMPIYENTP